MSRKAALACTAAGCALFALISFSRLADFPGLHGDEAWVGIYAKRLLAHGLVSPHEMNAYTGPLYGWLLARVFSWMRADVFALRLPGTLFNAAAVALMARHLWKSFGPSAALAWTGLLLASPLFLLKGRVAWEVYALQPLLLALLFPLLWRMLEDGRTSFLRAAGFLALCQIGVLNHFIFISVPLSLGVAALMGVALLEEKRFAGLLSASAWAILQSAIVYLSKPRVSEAFWQEHRATLLAAAVFLPFILAGIQQACGPMAEALIERARASATLRAKAFFRAAVFLSAAVCAAFHAPAMVAIGSGVAVLRRLSSWDPPLLLSVILYAWAAALLCVLFTASVRAACPSKADADPAVQGGGVYARFLLLWPLAYAAVFMLLRMTSSIRYYILFSFIVLAASAVLLPRALHRRRWAALALCGGFLVCGFSVRELFLGAERRPVRLRVGWRAENSWDFLPKQALLPEWRRSKACSAEPTSFIGLPLAFLRNSETRTEDCDSSIEFSARYCEECVRAPYFTWEVRPHG
ncbi:MAG: hypothetical protein WCU88_03550 [Elusimicrobiota bacterium]|jgi:hypothetical protein